MEPAQAAERFLGEASVGASAAQIHGESLDRRHDFMVDRSRQNVYRQNISEAGTLASVLTEDELFALPVHGPHGRIASVRHAMRLDQADFGKAVGKSRETVSHWENVDSAGKPRQRTNRQSSKLIARLARDELGLVIHDGAFCGSAEGPVDEMRRYQQEFASGQEEILALVAELRSRLAML
jgi:DNA-binding transcriptional regulator YiaG